MKSCRKEGISIDKFTSIDSQDPVFQLVTMAASSTTVSPVKELVVVLGLIVSTTSMRLPFSEVVVVVRFSSSTSVLAATSAMLLTSASILSRLTAPSTASIQASLLTMCIYRHPETRDPLTSATATQLPQRRHDDAGKSMDESSKEDLQLLIDSPRKWLRAFCCNRLRFGYPSGHSRLRLLPARTGHGDIAVEDLAKKAGLDVDRTSRIIRQLRTYRIFEELQPRRQDEQLRAVVHYSLDEMLKPAADCNVSLKANPYEAHQNLNPFVTRHGVGIFEFYQRSPEKARRFAKAIAGLRKMDSYLDYLLKDGFNWSALKGTVVNVPGKSLFLCLLLTHDLTINDAAAFLIRQCTHNWADKDVVTIFKAFVPGLKNSSPETPLLINDITIPKPGTWPRH
ncbi:hypothetical protein B0T09DRAFT_308306 [Sordaria sp. MPI-SDFR-AT-0083]|nr:hypothetical protein B0T09DRAFT_308306 [Sordaria sp. MPI-SDFR-AT-0083]